MISCVPGICKSNFFYIVNHSKKKAEKREDVQSHCRLGHCSSSVQSQGAASLPLAGRPSLGQRIRDLRCEPPLKSIHGLLEGPCLKRAFRPWAVGDCELAKPLPAFLASRSTHGVTKLLHTPPGVNVKYWNTIPTSWALCK